MKASSIKIAVKVKGEELAYTLISEAFKNLSEELAAVKAENHRLEAVNRLLTDELTPIEATPVKVACEVFNVTYSELKSDLRNRVISDARKVLFNHYRLTHPKLTLSKIGELLNKRHSTVLVGINQYRINYDNDKEFRKLADKFNNKINVS